MSMLAIAAVLCGCGEAAPPQSELPPAAGTYVHALRAMMNLKGCEGIRGQRTSMAELKRSRELIAKADANL